MSVPSEIPRSFSGSAQLAGMTLSALLEAEAGAATGAASAEGRGSLLVAYPAEVGLPAIWGPRVARSEFLYDDYSVFRADREQIGKGGEGRSLELRFGAGPLQTMDAPEAPGTVSTGAADLAVLFLPKGKESIEAAFSTVGRGMAPGGRVLVVGPKKSGIASSRKVARHYLGDEVAARSARHAKLYAYRRPTTAAPDPPPFSGRREYTAMAWGHEVRVVTLPGVFSHGRLDDGTRYLLEEASLGDLADSRPVADSEPPAALDFGCGAGILTAALRLALPAWRVDAVDRQAQALDATGATLAANGLDESGGSGEPATNRVFPSDVFSDIPRDAKGHYDLILSNPPFHSGHATDFSMTDRLITEAGHHLTPEGRLVMVTNTFIDYLTPLRRAFRRVEVLHESPRYRITRATRPR